MGVLEPSGGCPPDALAEGDQVPAPGLEFNTAAPQLQRINDDWEHQLHMMVDKAAELDGEAGGGG